jgi:HPt (histidine-containing phosphotransfer) domain-containing protein
MADQFSNNKDMMEIPRDAQIRYLERRKKDIESLRSALRNQTFDEFKRIGHQIKGNAASFGYHDLEKVAIQLEVAGERRDAEEARRQLELFEKWLAANPVT